MPKEKKSVRILSRILWVLVSLILIAAVFFLLIIGQPQPDKAEPQPVRKIPQPSASVRVGSENDMPKLMAGFPVPVMSFMSGSGMTFVSGTAEDTTANNVRGRRVTLYWQTGDGVPMTLISLCPADATELLGKGDYSFVRTAGPKLFGRSSVRMENNNTLRIHVQTDEGLYAVILPKQAADLLPELCRSIQLFTAPEA